MKKMILTAFFFLLSSCAANSLSSTNEPIAESSFSSSQITVVSSEEDSSDAVREDLSSEDYEWHITGDGSATFSVSKLYTCGWKLLMYHGTYHSFLTETESDQPDLIEAMSRYQDRDIDEEGYFIMNAYPETDGKTPESKLVLPDHYNGLPILGWLGTHYSEQTYDEENHTMKKDSSFASYEVLKEIVLPECFAWTCVYTFFGYSNLEKINLPSTMTYLSFGMFSDCPSIEIPSLENIRYDAKAFDGTNVRELVYGQRLEKLYDFEYADGFPKLEKVDLSQTEYEDLISIRNCPNLTEIDYPATLASIEWLQNANCPMLKTLRYGGTTDMWMSLPSNDNTFQGSSVEKVICSDGVIQVNEDGTYQKAE